MSEVEFMDRLVISLMPTLVEIVTYNSESALEVDDQVDILAYEIAKSACKARRKAFPPLYEMERE
jgi:hypothetical protein